MSSTHSLARGSDIAWVASEQRVVAIRLDSPADPPMILTAGAVRIWELLQHAMTLPDLVRSVAEVVGMDPTDIAADVEQFVSSALQNRLLVQSATGDR